MLQAVQYLQKAHRCSTQVVGWEKDAKKCEEVATQALALVQGGYIMCMFIAVYYGIPVCSIVMYPSKRIE